MTDRKPLAVLFLTVVVDLLGFGIVLPILPIWATRHGADALTVGLVMSIYSFTQLLFSPIWGRLSDRVGRRPIIVATALGAVGTYVLLGAADAVWMLFLGRALGGACGANISTAQAYIADVTRPEDRARGMAIIGAGFGLGFTFGPAIGGVAADLAGPRAPFFVAAGLAAANALSAWLFLPEPARHAERAHRRGSLADAFRIRALAPWLVVFLIVTFAFSNIEATFSLFTQAALGFEERENAYAFTMIGLTLTVVQLGATRPLTRRFGEARLVVAGTLCMAAGAAVLPFAGAWWHLGLPIVLLAAGNAINSPSLMASISKAAPLERQGEMLGVAQSLGALGRIAGPICGGALFDRHRAGPYVVAASVMVLAALMASLRASRAP